MTHFFWKHGQCVSAVSFYILFRFKNIFIGNCKVQFDKASINRMVFIILFLISEILSLFMWWIQ